MTIDVVQQEFDLKASEYESNRLAAWYKAHADEIINHCPLLAEGDILDVGCATGYQLRSLQQRNPNANLVGIDLSGNMISQAEKLSSESSNNFLFINDDWENLSEKSISTLNKFNFKLIVCANTLHYFKQPDLAVKHMFEQLDSDGMLLILEREKSNSWLTSVWGFLHRYFIKDQVEFYTADNVSQLMTQAGFQHAQIVTTIRKYFWKGKLFTSIALIKGEK